MSRLSHSNLLIRSCTDITKKGHAYTGAPVYDYLIVPCTRGVKKVGRDNPPVSRPVGPRLDTQVRT